MYDSACGGLFFLLVWFVFSDESGDENIMVKHEEITA